MNYKRYMRLKAQVESFKREADKTEGALAQAMFHLFEEFGCQTVKEGEAKLKSFDTTLRKLQTTIDSKLTQLERQLEQQNLTKE